LFISVPNFWIATVVIVFPAIWWGYSPAIIIHSFIEDPLANLATFIVPSVVLGMNMSGLTMRMTRSMMLEVLRQDYIRTAWAKGLRERVVLMRHALKNALIPVVTIVGLQAPVIIGGVVIIEQIFRLPGVGRLLINAILNRDLPLISGIVFMLSVAVVIINLLADLTYAYLDPRVHYH
jgi:peptide/nickel transport system permease protein